MLTLLQQCCGRSCRLRRDYIEGKDQVARVVGLADGIADVDVDRARVLAVETHDHIPDLDPRLPSTQRGGPGRGTPGGGLGIGAIEDVVVNFAAELRSHWPLADRRAEDQPHALFDLLLAGDERDPAGGVGSQWKGPAGADEFFAHCAITLVWPADAIIIGGPVGTTVPS